MSCRDRFRRDTVLLIAFLACVLSGAAQGAPSDLPGNCSAYTSIPLPAEARKIAAPASFPGCASYRSYRGVGRPVDYAAARSCAWQERLAQQARLPQNPKEGTAWVVGGSLILADLYANGAGVERNLPLAMKFACEFEESSAMLSVDRLAKWNDGAVKSGLFEFCDDAATTFTSNFCSFYASEIRNARRDRFYGALKSSMGIEQRVAFEKLLRAQKAYVATHAHEVDRSGTIHTVRMTASEEILNDLFHAEVLHFERKQWPSLTESQISGADALLQSEYEKKLQELRTPPQYETAAEAVTGEDLAKVEKQWITYRDAWDAFARLRYPSQAVAIHAEIARARYRLIRTI